MFSFRKPGLKAPADDRSDVLNRLPGLRQEGVMGLKNMEHPLPDFERHLHPLRPRLGRYLDAVIPDDLMLADLNEQWRQPGVIAENR